MSHHYGAAPNLPHTFRCTVHPEREGVGICVSCRSVVCVECSTKVDRMNYCIRCLQAAAVPAGDARRESPVADRLWGIPLLLLSFFLTAGIFAAMGLLLAVLRQWSPGGVPSG